MKSLYRRVGQPIDSSDGSLVRSTEVAVKVLLLDTTVRELTALDKWAADLLEIRDSASSRTAKTRQAYAATAQAKVIWPVVKALAILVKKHGWNQRSVKSKVGLTAAAGAAIVFGGQSAGLAALGTAVSVPLWVVFGSGALFAEMLREEISKKLSRLSNYADGVGDAIESTYVVHDETSDDKGGRR